MTHDHLITVRAWEADNDRHLDPETCLECDEWADECPHAPEPDPDEAWHERGEW